MIELFSEESSNAAWLREMRKLAHEGNVEFDQRPPRIVSRDFVTGCADEPQPEPEAA